MCNRSCLVFGENLLKEADIRGKRIIEIGSRDVNGSFREIVGRFEPAEYVGVDIEKGPGVDVICDVYDLVNRFGKESFDFVISTEMIEHVRDWQRAISQMKTILRPDGPLLVTTRSKGFPYHDYPSDFWRFELNDMSAIFADMEIEALEPDDSEPGVFVQARKPTPYTESDLSDYALYSMIKDQKSKDISNFEILMFKLKNLFKR